MNCNNKIKKIKELVNETDQVGLIADGASQDKYDSEVSSIFTLRNSDNENNFEEKIAISNNYIYSNNYKRVNRAGKWAMGIAIFNALGFFAVALFMDFDASVFDLLFELIINAIVFFLGYRIYMMQYIKTGTYLKIIMGIIIFSIVIRFIYGLSAGLSNIIMFFVILFALNEFSDLKKDIGFIKSLSK